MILKFRIKPILIFLIFSISFISCDSKNKGPENIKDSHPKTLIIGTFNIEWLGDGEHDQFQRSEDDYKNIADIIQTAEPDIMGLEEIENEEALSKLCKYLKTYTYKLISNGSKQNVAVLYKKNIKLKSVVYYSPIQVIEHSTRPGLLIEAKKGNFDFKMMVVHFKSSSSFDRTEEKKERSISIRTEQANILSNWIDSSYQKSKEKDLIIVGDFNDSPMDEKSPTLTSLLNNKFSQFLTADLESCKNKKWKQIDHIIVSKSAQTRYIENSLFMYNFRKTDSKSISEKISDHCPVFASFDITKKDND